MKGVVFISLLLAVSLGGGFAYWYYKNVYVSPVTNTAVKPLEVNTTRPIASSRFAGRVERTTYNLTVYHANKTWNKIDTYLDVVPGDRVVTDNFGTAKLTLSSGSRLLLKSDSQVDVVSANSAKADLGTFIITSTDQLIVNTLLGTIQSSNANFVLKTDGTKTHVYVKLGMVSGQAKSGQTFTLNASEMAVITTSGVTVSLATPTPDWAK